MEQLYAHLTRHVGQLLSLLWCQLEQQRVQLSPFTLLWLELLLLQLLLLMQQLLLCTGASMQGCCRSIHGRLCLRRWLLLLHGQSSQHISNIA